MQSPNDKEEYILVLKPLKERELLIKTVIRRGFRLAIIDEINSDFIGFADLPIVVNSIKNNDEVFEAAIHFSEKVRICAVITTLDYLLPVVGKINDALGLRGHSEKSASKCTSKILQRDIMRIHSPQISTQYFTINRYEDLLRKIQNVSFPVIIKPSNGTASKGVSKIYDITKAKEAFEHARIYSNFEEVIVEEFIDGYEVSLETYTQGRKTELISIAGKIVEPGDKFLESGRLIPAILSDEDKAAAFSAVTHIIDLLECDDVVLHTEVKINSGEAKIIEVNGRVVGGMMPDMILNAIGLNIYDVNIDILLGIPVRKEVLKNKFTAFEAIINKESGFFLNSTFDSNKVYESNSNIRVFVKKGEYLKMPENDNDVIGYVYATADSLEGAKKIAKDICDGININYTK